MGPTDRKVILTGMVVCGVIIVLGLATGVVGVALLGTMGVAVLALMLIWARGPEIQFYQAAPVIGSGPRKHGGCLTWFMLVWIAFEIFGLATLSLGPLPDDLVNWGALSRYGDFPVIGTLSCWWCCPSSGLAA